MVTKILAPTFCVLALLVLGACDSFINDDPEEEGKWWDSYYGKSSEPESDCDFYGNCKSAKKSGSGW